MHNEGQLPDLTFPDVEFGKNETPWNLNILLYKGASAVKSNAATQQKILNGKFGEPLLERLELVSRLHGEINASFKSGGSRATVEAQRLTLRYFFAFAERASKALTLATVEETYRAWVDSLVLRTRLPRKNKSANVPDRKPLSVLSAYGYAATVGTFLDHILDRVTCIIETTGLKFPPRRITAVGTQAEKQNLSHTFAFGHMLQDICDGLTLRTTLEVPFPVQIELRAGKTITRQEPTLWPEGSKRNSLVNLRIEAELLMFIGQTGMNLEEAANLEFRHFSYMSYNDSYQVRDYKHRRHGPVLFHIFKDYKSHLERYLEWRRKLFRKSNRLFPFIRFDGARDGRRFSADRMRKICKEVDIPFIPPQSLRNTRVNWLLRLTGDPILTAETSQHTKEVLKNKYERASYQRTTVEATRFWLKADPHLRTEAVAPGDCTGTPQAVANIPPEAPKPDCKRASGCLWCANHRDVDSFDYTWALSSFHHIKVIELSKDRLPRRDEDAPPAQRSIERIQEKLKWFEESSETRRRWVEEAQMRIAEGDFHPDFNVEIRELEGEHDPMDP
ncbi:site-specific integrase [Cupriavidus neocaledonicus]|uniref:site-specific integrase n=1 Tax=Cupriavidus neocaledonicus TaxID=1040979 RepID=UPI0003A98BBF|nr:site-specific integrase [Cupriavidus neocaledonicus]